MAGEIMRYEIEGGDGRFEWCAWEDENGEWVRYNDFLPILERLEAAEKALGEIAARPEQMAWGEDYEVREAMNEMEQTARAHMEKYHGR